jgi:Protein of unknown function (DUF2726)
VKLQSLIGYRALQARSQIDSLLSGTGWFLTVETRVRDVIRLDDGETLRDDLAPQFKKARFDFVIASTDDAVPRLVIELDGPIHDDPNVMSRDAHKDELCVRAGLPIVRLPIAHLETHDQATALEWIVGEFLRFQKEFPPLRRRLARENDAWSDHDVYELARFEWREFNRRRFPAIDRIVERLATKFAIVEEDAPGTFFARDASLVLHTRPPLLRGEEDVTCEVLRDHQVVLRVSQPVSTTPRMSGIRNLDLREMDEEFWSGGGHIDFALVFACFHAIGWYRHEVDEQVATWFALRDVERWAQRELVV